MLLQEGTRGKVSDKPFFVQMPSQLPFDLPKDVAKLGKLRFYKSGKVVLRIGNIDLNVTQGINNSFYQQLVQLKQEGVSFLSSLSEKVVITPDLD